MKFFVFALCLVACVSAADDDAAAPILKSDFVSDPEGFHYSFETGNGISAQVQGKVKELGKDEVAIEVHGSSQHQSPEGETIQLTYVANEFGFQPQGAHLPTTPEPVPIPSYIQRAIEYIAAHPYEEKKKY